MQTNDEGEMVGEFELILQEIQELHNSKGLDYGTDDDQYANVNQSRDFGIQPWIAAVMKANDKMTRLKTFAVKGKLKNESMENSLLDMANYSIIALVLWRQSAQKDRPTILKKKLLDKALSELGESESTAAARFYGNGSQE